MSISVGIDLGTTFSAVAYIDPKSKSPQIIPNREGKRITPSVIQFLDGDIIFGSEAEDAYNAGEPNCVATFKREMGNDEPYCYIDGVPYTSEKLSSLLLRYLKENAEEVLGDTIKDAVITVPAYFYSREREATYRAAEAAGLKVKKIIDEPNAAAMAYGLNNWRENANILVYDLGGGTFDVTLVHMGKNGELSTVTTRGNHKLGGRDWDNRIEDILFDRFEDETGLDLRSDSDLSAIVRGMCEDIKKNLSVMATAKATASFPDFGRASVSISRQEFEESTSDLLERTGALCQAVLDEAGITARNITDILLVGGSTRMPQVSSYLQRLFGKKPITHVNPDEAVALGAAIQSSKQNTEYTSLSVQVVEGKKVTDRSNSGLGKYVAVKPSQKLDSLSVLNLRETTAHALGVVAINDEENCYYNEVIIPANHPRPVRAAKKFRYYTSPTAPNTLDVYMVQGDNPNPLDCLIPYKYVVSGIQHVNKGEKIGTIIRVQYSYDDNGIIHVQARQGDSNKDLPIRKDDAPTDISKFGRPVKSSNNASGSSLGLMINRDSTGGAIHKYKAVTFSNAEWEKYDRISDHPSGAEFNEPSIHVIADEKKIEFHGYNVSQMDEGVTYTIDGSDDFEIECNIDTSTIQPHPGGFLKILLGIISANLNENGGSILLEDEVVATVGSKFHLKMALSDGGHYEVFVDGKLAGSKYSPTSGGIDVIFGFEHEAHYCHILSHAYISNIDMMQRTNGGEDESAGTPTWDD